MSGPSTAIRVWCSAASASSRACAASVRRERLGSSGSHVRRYRLRWLAPVQLVVDPMSVEAFAKALAAFQAELPSVGKDKTATVKSDKGQFSYSFADLTKITEKVMPLLSKHGLSFTALPTVTDRGFVLAYSLIHEGGYQVDGAYPLPTNGTAQQIGSAITYARRYCLCAATGVAPGGEDDDGAKASEVRAQPRQQVNGNGHVNAGLDDMQSAKARVWASAQALGFDTGRMHDDYESDHGSPIGMATVEELSLYAADLEARVKAAAS